MPNPWDNDPVVGGGIQTKPADPKLPAEVQGLGLRNRQTVQEINRNAALLAPTLAKAKADAAKAQAEAKQAQVGTANAPSVLSVQLQKQLANDEILRRIGLARKETSGWSTGVFGNLLRFMPATDARNLSSDINTISSRVTQDVLQNLKSQSSTGASGFGALSEKEGQLLRDSVASLDQSQSKDHFLRNLRDVENHYRALQAIQNNEDPRKPNVASKYGIVRGDGPATIDFNDLPE